MNQTRWQPKSTITLAEIQAIASIALMIAIAVAIMAFCILDMDWQDEVRAAAIAACVAFAIAMFFVYKIERIDVYSIEKITRRDLDGDGNVGKPKPVPAIESESAPTTNTILVRERDGFARMYKLPGSGGSVREANLHAFLEAVEDDDGTTLEAAYRVRMMRPEWDAVMSCGARLGLWTAKSQGHNAVLLASVDEIMSRFFGE